MAKIDEVIESLANKAKKDLLIDKSSLDSESLRTPYISSSWMNAYRVYKEKLRQKEYSFKKTYKEKWLYYTGRADPDVYKINPLNLKVLKSNVNIFLDADDELEQTRQSMENMRDIVKFVEGIIGEINKRSFHIRNALEFIKWKNGG